MRPSLKAKLERLPSWAGWLGLLLLAGLIRVGSILSLSSDPRVNDPILDGKDYLELAARLSRGEGWPAGPFFMGPLYPWTLGWLFRVLPPTPLSVHILQSALGLLTGAFLVAAARRHLGRGTAVAAGVLYLLTGPILGMESQVLSESLLLCLTTAALYLWPGATRRWWENALFGVVCGLLSAGRGVFLLLLVGAALVLLLLPRPQPRRNQPAGEFSRLFRTLALIAAGALAALMPMAVHQTRSTGRLQILPLNGGMNLYIGNNPAARGTYAGRPEINLESDFMATHSASILLGRNLTLAESSDYWRRRALSYLAGNPGHAAWLLGRKALLYLAPREVPQIEDFQILRERHLPLRLAWIDFRWILPLAVLGVSSWLWVLRRKGTVGSMDVTGSNPTPWLTLIVTGWISTIAFFATGRYRVPFLPGFLGLAAVGAVSLTGPLRDASKRRRRALLLLAVPAAILVQLVLPGYSEVEARVHDAYQVALRLEQSGHPAEALQECREAIRLWPDDGAAWHASAIALVDLGRLPEAAEAYRQALTRMPHSALTHYNLGLVYGRMGDHARALQELGEAARLDPFDPRIRCDLGVALSRTGRRDEAVRVFQEILRRWPDHALARQNLAKLGAAP